MIRSSNGLVTAAQLGEDVQRDHNSDVNEAHDHDGGRPELPAGGVLCKECKLVSLTLSGALLTG